MRTSLICMLAFLALSTNAVHGQDTLPSWVPEQAFLTAEKQWNAWMKDYRPTSLWRDFGLTNTSEALSCILKNPYRLIRLDYEDYEDDCALSKFLTSSRVPHDSAYGFGIYHGDNVVGHICVEYEDSSWTLLELHGYRSPSRGDLFAPIYDRYPIASGYVIYREDWSGTFFVFKDGNFIRAFAIQAFVDGHYEAIELKEYLRQERERITKAKEMSQK